MNLPALSAAVQAVCPLVACISIGDPADKATWRLAFGDGATDDQRRAAQSVVDGWVDPPPAPVVATVTGNQWAFALADLGLSGFWEAGVAKSKPKDRIRVGLIARDTPLLASDPLLVRVAANAGAANADGSGAALIDVAAVFARASGMPL